MILGVLSLILQIYFSGKVFIQVMLVCGCVPFHQSDGTGWSLRDAFLPTYKNKLYIGRKFWILLDVYCFSSYLKLHIPPWALFSEKVNQQLGLLAAGGHCSVLLGDGRDGILAADSLLLLDQGPPRRSRESAAKTHLSLSLSQCKVTQYSFLSDLLILRNYWERAKSRGSEARRGKERKGEKEDTEEEKIYHI